MKKNKFILPLITVSVISAFAFVSKKPSNTKFATTYFVFNGTATSQYTDSTKWTKSTSNPNPSCPGDEIACLVSSTTLETRTQLVAFIQSNSGVISGQATILDKKDAD